MKVMNKYNVIEANDILVVGDVIKEQEDGTYLVEYTNDKIDGVNYRCKIQMNDGYVNSLLIRGLIEPVVLTGKVTTKAVDESCKLLKQSFDKLNTKVIDYVQFLNDMRNAYEQDKMNVIESYTDGDVSVNEYKQSVTVYENLIKFINVSLKKLA